MDVKSRGVHLSLVAAGSLLIVIWLIVLATGVRLTYDAEYNSKVSYEKCVHGGYLVVEPLPPRLICLSTEPGEDEYSGFWKNRVETFPPIQSYYGVASDPLIWADVAALLGLLSIIAGITMIARNGSRLKDQRA